MFLAKFTTKFQVNSTKNSSLENTQPKNQYLIHNYRHAHIIYQDLNYLKSFTVFNRSSLILYTAYSYKSSYIWKIFKTPRRNFNESGTKCNKNESCKKGICFKGFHLNPLCSKVVDSDPSSILSEFGTLPKNLKPWRCAKRTDDCKKKTSVCLIGSGNWASAIATIVGKNAKQLKEFEDTVNMYVFPEVVDGKNLVDIINEKHENVKYLKGVKLPKNVVAVPNVVEAAKNADILVFVLPHEFVPKLCEVLKGNIKKNATAISLIKGFRQKKEGGLELISEVIQRTLGISCSVLMGANLATGVALGEFSESTIGCCDEKHAENLRLIMQADHFRTVVVRDVKAVEMCGALKNIVAVAAGFCDGMKLGNNTKAAVVRLGLMESIRFIEEFYPGNDITVFFESCGIADFITTCYGGRNRRVGEAFVTQKKSIEVLEKEMLKGQKLAGPKTAVDVNFMLKKRCLEKDYPMFTAVHNICTGKLKPQDLIKKITNHPEHDRTMQKYLNKEGVDNMDIVISKTDKEICEHCGCPKCGCATCDGNCEQCCHRNSF